MTDVSHEVNAVDRRVGERTIPAGQARTVTVARTYDTTPEDLWDACTRAERIARWFLPVSGELREGGRYQLEGNAGGTIERCDPPRAFDATWEYGPMTSWIELRIGPAEDGRARFELHHIALVDDGGHWERYGPGAVGVGWDLGLLGLGRHLASGDPVDPKAFEAWTTSDEGRAFIAGASTGWGEAAIAAGEDPEAARAAAQRTAAFYTGTA
ncbi:MAG TPA: SRPBCC domain-containing protein [Capillimicrobium sp.]|nr:SRPBCC domain-containing protein [Capillimicrobium sp.]